MKELRLRLFELKMLFPRRRFSKFCVWLHKYGEYIYIKSFAANQDNMTYRADFGKPFYRYPSDQTVLITLSPLLICITPYPILTHSSLPLLGTDLWRGYDERKWGEIMGEEPSTGYKQLSLNAFTSIKIIPNSKPQPNARDEKNVLTYFHADVFLFGK